MTPNITPRRDRDTIGLVLLAAIVGLTLATAWIHFNLGGLLFTLNAVGYAVLTIAVVVAAFASFRVAHLLGWLPSVALMGFAGLTIAGWLVMGPRFQLAYVTKVIEVVLIALLVVDVVRHYGGPAEILRRTREALDQLRGRGTVAAL